MSSDPYNIDNNNFQTAIVTANVNTGAIQSTISVPSSFYNFKSDQILSTSFDPNSKNLYLLILTNVYVKFILVLISIRQYPSMSTFKIVSVGVSNGQFAIEFNSPLSNSDAFIYVSSAFDAADGIYYVVMGTGSQGSWELYALNIQSKTASVVTAPYGFVSIA